MSEALTIQGGANTLVSNLGGPLGFGTLDLIASDSVADDGDGGGGALNAAGGAPVLLGSGGIDDGFWQVNLASVFPNGINFFGIRYTTMFIGTNGYVTFGAGSPGRSATGIQFSKKPIIAAQYKDLLFVNLIGNKIGSLFLSYDTTVADPVVTITFYDVLAFGGGTTSRNRFQIRIHNTGGGTVLTGADFAAELRYNQLQFGGTGSVAGFADGTATGGGGADVGTVATTRFGTLASACLSPNFLLNASNAACTNRTPGVGGVYVWSSRSPAAVAAIAGDGQSTNVGMAFPLALIARVTDLSGAALQGVTVTFTCPASAASCTLFDGEGGTTSVTAATNSAGVASALATANGTAGAYSVSAAVAGVATPAAFALTNAAVVSAASIAVNGGSGQQATVGTPFTTALSVIVRNASSLPVAGVVVNFVAPTTGARATLSAASATTNASGIATITATAGTVAGGYNVTATVNATALSTTLALVNLAGAPASITATSGGGQSVTVGAAFPTALAVIVRDASSNPVSGAIVNFTAPPTGATAIVSAPSATTSSAGAASVTATAGAVAGAYSVTATVNGTALSATFSLTNTPGAPASITVVIGSGQSATVGTPFVSPLAVAVADAGGNAVPGVTVLFTVPGSGASASVGTGSAITGATGQAFAIATANTVAGGYNVTATVNATALSTTLALVNLTGPPASITATSGGGQSVTVGAAFPTALAVVVRDASSNPVSGAIVNFTAPPTGPTAIVSAPSATTSSAGAVSVNATAGTVSGAYSVTATVMGTALSATFSLANTPGAPASIIVVTGNGQSATVGTPFAAPLAVAVADAGGNAVPGATVLFIVPGSGASASVGTGSAITGATGQAALIATANTVAGSYPVTAAVMGTGLSLTLELTNSPGAPASITALFGSGQSVIVGRAFTGPLTAVVRDASNNPIPGATVNFTRPPSGASATLSASSVTTSSTGAASISAIASTVAGSYNVTATVSGTAVATTFALTNRPGAAASIVVLSGAGQSAAVGTPFAVPLAVTVADSFGNGASGVTVQFVAPASGASATLSASSATTGAAGQAAVTASATTIAGTYGVIASITGTALSVTLELTNNLGAPASITVLTGSGQSAVVGTAFAATLGAVVRDASNNPIPGAIINFTRPPSGASATLSASSVTTSSGGTASISALAGTVAGSYNVTATVNGTAVATTFALTNRPGAPASIVVLTGAGQSATVGTPFAIPLAVTVADSFGNATAGVPVQFVAPASGASATLSAASASTGAAGQASVTASATTVAGNYNVTASITGTALSATLGLTNNAGAVASITVLTGSGQSAVAGTPFPTSLVAQVRDANDNPVAGAIINFSKPSTGATATLSATQATTDSAGTAGITATAGAISGTYPITATVGATSLATTFTVTNGAGAPETVAFSGGGGTQSTIVGTPFALPLAVVVRDSLGNGVPNVTVTVTAPGAGATANLGAGTAVTGSDGIASVSASASTVTGDYSVSAAIEGGLSVSFSLSNRPGAPASIVVAPGSSPQSAQVSSALGHSLGVTVTDQFGNGVPSISVAFSAPSSGASATLSSPTAITNASGQTAVTATVNTTPGTFGVTAIVTDTSLTASFTITNSPGAPASIRISSGSPQSTTVGVSTASPLTVVVADAFGNPVPDAQVVFDAPATGASAVLGAITSTTDATGTASVTATANTVTGHYLVSASVDDGGAPVSFDLTNTPGAPATITAALTATPQAARVATAFTNSLGATVRDQYGNLIPGVTVSYAVPSGGATVTLDAASATTDASGRAAVAATAGMIAGAVTVTARVALLATPATFSLTNLPGAPSVLVADNGSGQDAVVATAFGIRLGARLRDGFGNTVPGSTVTFTAPTTGATATFDSATAVTDANGLATVGVTAGTTASTISYSVLATTVGASAPAAYLLRNLPGAPASIQPVATATPQSATVATAFAGALEVVVQDAYGNAAPLATVTFAAPTTPGATATLSATSVATNAAGHAEVNATASSTTGSYGVTASVAGAVSPARFDLTNLPDAASSVTATSGSPQSAPVSAAFTAALTVVVRDQFGNVAPAVTVTFAAPNQGATAALDATTAITDDTGTAHITAHAGQITGGYTVTASAPGAAAPAPFALTNNPGQAHHTTIVSGDGQHTMASAPFGAPLVVRVADTFDNPVPGATVTFSAPTSGASAGISVASAVTNGQGQAQVTATANRTLGAYSVTADVAGVATAATFGLTNDAILTTLSLTADTNTASSHQTVNLLVTLSSPLGVPTGIVHISIDGAPAFDVTPHDGVAQVPYRVSSLGTHTFLAQYDGEESFAAATSEVLEIVVKGDAGSIGGGGCGCAIPPGAPRAGDVWFIALAGFGARWLFRRRPRARRAARRSDLERAK